MINLFRRKKQEEEPDDLAQHLLVEEPEEAPWPRERRLRPLNTHKYIVWMAKLLFFVYTLLSVALVLDAPIGLLFTVPTILVILDYIRNDKIYSEVLTWFDPEEKKQRDTAGAG